MTLETVKVSPEEAQNYLKILNKTLKNNQASKKYHERNKEKRNHIKRERRATGKDTVLDYLNRYKRRINQLLEIGSACFNCNLHIFDPKALRSDMNTILQIDHIDGNTKNTSKENKRLLCPNCHAKTSTFTGKNNTKYNYPPKLVEQINKERLNWITSLDVN